MAEAEAEAEENLSRLVAVHGGRLRWSLWLHHCLSMENGWMALLVECLLLPSPSHHREYFFPVHPFSPSIPSRHTPLQQTHTTK